MNKINTVILLVLIVGGVVAVALRWNLQNFPTPTGGYGVGTLERHLIDVDREEPSKQGAPRELMLHIWYPTNTKSAQPTMPYDTDALHSALEFLSSASKVPAFFFSRIQNTKTFGQLNAPIAAEHTSYPVIILCHGAGTMIQHYAFLGEELASQGYIVVGVNHPYMAAITRFPDGRVIESLSTEKQKEGKAAQLAFKEQQFTIAIADIRFVVDSLITLNNDTAWPLAGKLDAEHLGICGHSAGGSLALRMCIEDARFKVGVSLDGSTDRGNPTLASFTTPFLFIRGESSHVWRDQEGQLRKEKLMELCHKPGMDMTVITFMNNGHGTFSDLPILLNQTIATQLLSQYVDINIGASSAHAMRAITVVKKYVNAFFATYLYNRPSLFFEHPKCDLVVEM